MTDEQRAAYPDFVHSKLNDFMCNKEMTGATIKVIENLIWLEWKEIHWYKNPPVQRNGIPAGKLCNPDFGNWCPYLGSGCMYFSKCLTSDSRMSMEFYRMRKCDECRAAFPKGKNLQQTKLE